MHLFSRDSYRNYLCFDCYCKTFLIHSSQDFTFDDFFLNLSGPDLYQKPDVCHGCKYEALRCEWLGT